MYIAITHGFNCVVPAWMSLHNQIQVSFKRWRFFIYFIKIQKHHTFYISTYYCENAPQQILRTIFYKGQSCNLYPPRYLIWFIVSTFKTWPTDSFGLLYAKHSRQNHCIVYNGATKWNLLKFFALWEIWQRNVDFSTQEWLPCLHLESR